MVSILAAAALRVLSSHLGTSGRKELFDNVSSASANIATLGDLLRALTDLDVSVGNGLISVNSKLCQMYEFAPTLGDLYATTPESSNAKVFLLKAGAPC